MRYSGITIIAICAALMAGVADAAPKNPPAPETPSHIYRFAGYSMDTFFGDTLDTQ